MFRKLFLFIIACSSLTTSTFVLVACDWDLQPAVLLITSYEFAQYQDSEDKLIYHELQSNYGDKVVSVTFSYQDDNSYANILRNLIETYDLKKVFILDPSFHKYLPSDDTQKPKMPSNLVRILQQFNNVQFYFFNNQIANSIKITNNIFEFRFDVPNTTIQTPETYGKSIADHFYKLLLNELEPGTVDLQKYNFEINSAGKAIINIGVINNIGNSYQQNVLNEFVADLQSGNHVFNNAVYQFFQINLANNLSVYNNTNIELVRQSAISLYTENHVNFILNTNYWYNNAIAYAASATAKLPNYTKTIKLIANNVFDNKAYMLQDNDYLLFSYNPDLKQFFKDVFNNTLDNYKVLPSAPENINAYGLNSNLSFIDGI